MCGISVAVALPRIEVPLNASNGPTYGNPSPGNLRTRLGESLSKISHRGPDAKGIWVSADQRIGLGHCRLSINDLTPSGAQPLHSRCGTVHAVVNGEIYDFDRLRGEVTREHGYQFRGHSDSEVLVALYLVYGSPGFLEHLRGEFAFVLYDEAHKKVIAVRDRFGVKPLFWTIVGGAEENTRTLLFASEAKAFLPLGWKPEWDVTSIIEGGWLQDDRTLFKGVVSLAPGTWMEINATDGNITTHEYWDVMFENKHKVEKRTVDEMVEGLREHMLDAIRLRLRADVPVGIYLSGGIDSSVIAGMVMHLMRKEHVSVGDVPSALFEKVKCFCIRFPTDAGFDESPIAARTAAFLGVSMQMADMEEATLATCFADAAYHSEHHHFDLNTVAKFALSELPRIHGVKVVLTGEGADEHFAGYPFFPPELLREPDLSMLDQPLSKEDATEAREVLLRSAEDEMRMLFPLGGGFDHGLRGDDGSRAAMATHGSIFTGATLAWHPTKELFAPWARNRHASLDCREIVVDSWPDGGREAISRGEWHPLHAAQYIYIKGPMSNMILSCLGDRVEMAHGIEGRTPFLDHHLTEYVNRLPPSVKMHYEGPPRTDGADQNGTGDSFWWQKDMKTTRDLLSEKWILRQAAKPFITQELYNRKKHAFSAPLNWPRDGPICRMLEGLLTERAVTALGFVDWKVVKECLRTAFVDPGSLSRPDPKAFRMLLFVAAWIVLAERLGIPQADSTMV